MPSTIFSGSKVKTLKSTLSLNGGADIISSTTNPQTSAVSAEPGSLLLNTTSGTMYRKLDAGSTTNWVEVGAGTGGKNYIKNPDFDGGATTSWSMQKVSLSSFIPTGNIGAADAGHTIATSSSSPLEGANSLLVQGASAFTAGNCLVSAAFTIDREDVAKVMGWSFSYEAITTNMDFSGTTANTWAVYIAEVTTATPDTVVSWIQPAGVYNLVQGSGVGLASGTFQTTATESSAYRIVLVCINSEAAATTLKVDDFQLGPQKVVYGSPVTDWQQYSPAASFVGFGTVSATNLWSRRVGDSLEVLGTFTAGTPSGSVAQIPLGFSGGIANVNVDGTKAAAGVSVGVAPLSGSSTTNSAYHFLSAGTQPYINMAIQGDTNSGIIAAAGSTLTGAGATLRVHFIVPISGWSSSVQMSNDTDTRVVATRRDGGTAASFNADTLVTFANTATIDTHSGWINSSEYKISVSGVYKISALFLTNAAPLGVTGAFQVYYRVNNGTSLRLGYVTGNGNSAEYSAGGSDSVSLNAGDLITFRVTSSSTHTLSPAACKVSIERLPGPATIAASESVQAKFWASANGTCNASTPINFDSKVYDSHGAVTTGAAWKFTAPISGKYQINTFINSSSVPAGNVYLIVHKNGSALESIGYIPVSPGTTSAPDVIEMNAGEYIDIRTNANFPWYGGGGVRTGSPCLITITKAGN